MSFELLSRSTGSRNARHLVSHALDGTNFRFLQLVVNQSVFSKVIRFQILVVSVCVVNNSLAVDHCLHVHFLVEKQVQNISQITGSSNFRGHAMAELAYSGAAIC